jgi:hypothetical protein
MLTYYNDDIDEEERKRRWRSLKRADANKAIQDANAWALAPKAEEDPWFTTEIKESIEEKWWENVDMLETLPERTIERRKETFDAFYAEERKAWEWQLASEMQTYRDQEQKYSKFTREGIESARKQFGSWHLTWRSQMRDQYYELKDQLVKLEKLHAEDVKRYDKGEGTLADISSVWEAIIEIEDRIGNLPKAWSRRVEKRKEEQERNREALQWINTRDQVKASMTKRFSEKLKAWERLKEAEFKELFESNDASEEYEEEGDDQDNQPDLNQEIAVALANHAVLVALANHERCF